MWETVRHELGRLEWDAAPPLTQDLLSEWTQTVANLIAIRRLLGPVTAQDPIAMLATASTGAARTPGAESIVAPSLHGVSDAIASAAGLLKVVSEDVRHSHVATLNHVAYELAHWVRVRATDDRVTAWLLAGETALDSAIHAPVGRSTIGIGLAAWQDALAAVQPVQSASIVRRSVALGHLGILRNAHALVLEAGQSGALPRPYCDVLLGDIHQLARAHQTALSQITSRGLGSTRLDQAVMLKLGGAVRQLTGQSDITETSRTRLDALLRSSLGEAVLVANLTNVTAAKPVADRIGRLALEYLAHPGILRPTSGPDSLSAKAPVDRNPVPVQERSAPDIVGEPSIAPGTVLEGDTITSLCRARDLGVAAASGDPTNPPDNLRGIDPSRWPQLAVEGRQAVTDLVTSVIPMVYAQTRHVLHAADVQGQMFVELMGAAYRFDPQRTAPERWPTYAWMSLEHVRRHGVDQAGVARSHSRLPQATVVTLGEIEPASREPAPGATIEERQSTEAIKQALGRLPHSLQGPLLESMQGRSERVIAEEGGFSESTARRRILEAREALKRELATHADDADEGPYETVTDPALERSQHMFDETFPTSHAEHRRAPYR
jgi:DNA-directed RNA polymerase specialized sigma24 family protein